MNKFLLPLLFGAFSFCVSAQPNKPQSNKTIQLPPAQKNAKKYSSLLWEIRGNGLTKPSYLFGTMHVSDKLAFHLGDSFYNALKSVQVVAL
ncbi:MAG TPA: TraB/GumN family protein, partial [Flavisolibacter sp.]|nr:TraB/GumN family protein [Flavisolibacter sp.]